MEVWSTKIESPVVVMTIGRFEVGFMLAHLQTYVRRQNATDGLFFTYNIRSCIPRTTPKVGYSSY